MYVIKHICRLRDHSWRWCKGVKRPLCTLLQVMESQTGVTELSTKERKLITIIQKQDRLLYMCFYLLLNLAEDSAVERKMKRKGIVAQLLRMLERSNVELLILAVTFLKKLSIYKDNKDQMLKVLLMVLFPMLTLCL